MHGRARRRVAGAASTLPGELCTNAAGAGAAAAAITGAGAGLGTDGVGTATGFAGSRIRASKGFSCLKYRKAMAAMMPTSRMTAAICTGLRSSTPHLPLDPLDPSPLIGRDHGVAAASISAWRLARAFGPGAYSCSTISASRLTCCTAATASGPALFAALFTAR